MMAGVIIFLDKTSVPNNLTEIHFFEHENQLIQFSIANMHRKHLVRSVPDEAWHRTPSAPEQPKSSPWTCFICGGRVQIDDDLQPHHLASGYDHDAKLSPEDLQDLAEAMRMSD
jgi:hypothetical protein